MIKKSLLIGSALLLLAVLAAPDAQALSPIRFGVKAGIQTQSLKMQGMNWNELSKSNNFGYQLGVMAQVPLGPVYLQPEIFYSSARFKLQGDLLNPDGTMAESDVSAKYSVNTVQLPVLVGIKLLFLRVFAGSVVQPADRHIQQIGQRGGIVQLERHEVGRRIPGRSRRRNRQVQYRYPLRRTNSRNRCRLLPSAKTTPRRSKPK